MWYKEVWHTSRKEEEAGEEIRLVFSIEWKESVFGNRIIGQLKCALELSVV